MNKSCVAYEQSEWLCMDKCYCVIKLALNGCGDRILTMQAVHACISNSGASGVIDSACACDEKNYCNSFSLLCIENSVVCYCRTSLRLMADLSLLTHGIKLQM